MKIYTLLSALVLTLCLGCVDKENDLTIDFSKDIDSTKINISMENLALQKQLIAVYDGEKVYGIKTEYGKNKWFFDYNDSLYAYHSQFIFNRNDRFKYKFHFFKKNDTIYINIITKGKNIDIQKNTVIAMSSKRDTLQR